MTSKTDKRKEAGERAAYRKSISTEQHIEKLNKEGWRAAKERKRLGYPEIPENCNK